MVHIPVLQNEILKYLNPKPNENFIDCTIGEGGHSLAILEATEPDGRLLGIDWDEEIVKSLRFKVQGLKFKERLILVCGNFANLEEIVKKQKIRAVQGILFDLGVSSWHLEKSERGFSFQRKEPLDMRYNPQNPLTAEKIINYWSASEIEKILREYGEERWARQIAQNIIEFRKIKPITTTSQLIDIVKKSIPAKFRRKKIHPATQTFQALRIAVNDELNNLEKALPQALKILKPGDATHPPPRIAVISFHSLEDRIIKNFFKEKAKENLLKILTKKPIRPTNKEIKINPRSRSAKLRAGQKI